LLHILQIKEPSLNSLWKSKQAGLVAALVVQAVISYDSLCKYLNSDCHDEKRFMIVQRYKIILDSLHHLDSAASDRGVAYAIEFVTSRSLKHESSINSEDQMCSLSSILANSESFATAKKNMSAEGKPAAPDLAALSGAAFLLPPRVALEHADATVRINAIAGLKVMDIASVEPDLGQALLRRLSLDNDQTVVVSAGEVLTRMLEHHLEEDESDASFDDLDSWATGVLVALFHWTLIGKDESWSPSILLDTSKAPNSMKSNNAETAPLLACLRLAGLVGKVIRKSSGTDGTNSYLYYLTVLSLTAHIHVIKRKGCINEISQAAAAALSQLLELDDKLPTFQSLFSNNTCSNVIQYFYGTDREVAKDKKPVVPDMIRKRFLWLSLHSLSESISSSPSLPQSRQITILTLYQMQSFNKESKKSPSFELECQKLTDAMAQCLTVIGAHEEGELPNVFLQLVSVSSNASFNSVAKPVITMFVAGLADYNGLTSLANATLHPTAQAPNISRLLTVLTESFGKRTSAEGAAELLISLISLLSHQDRGVRQKAMAALEKFYSVKEEIVKLVCTKATDKHSPTWSSMLMDGANALPQLLAYIVTSSKSPDKLQEYLIQGCLSCSLNGGGGLSQYGCHAAAVLLSAMEKAGETAFPLSKRWELAGEKIFEAFYANDGVESSQDELRFCVATMLKGVIVTDTQSDGQIISIGPSKSGRVRSYSVGTSDIHLLQPYPKEMTDAVLKALNPSSPKALTQSVIHLVLLRQSWTSGVYPKLDSQSKESILSSLLDLRTAHDNELAGKALSNLPLKAGDMMYLVKKLDVSASEIDQLAMVFVADVIRGKLDSFEKASDVSKVSAMMFEHLHSLSKNENVGDSGGAEYTRISILLSLLALHSSYKDQLSELSQKRKSSGRKRSRSHSDVGCPDQIASQAQLLVDLVGGNNTIISLHSARGKSLSLSLLTCLCEESPSTVVTSLLPALERHAVGDALSAIVPAFCSHAHSAGLSLFDLLDVFVPKIVTDIPGNKSMVDQFVNALMTLPGNEASESMSAFITFVIALESFNLQFQSRDDNDSSHKEYSKSDILFVITNLSSVSRVSIALSLLQYAENLMAFICDSSLDMDVNKMRIIHLAVKGSGGDQSSISYNEFTRPQKRSMLYLTFSLLQGVQDIISTPSARKLGPEADLCLRLWQELMQTHVTSLSFHAKQDRDSLDLDEKKFWAAIPVLTNDCLDNLQNLLPVSHFLASVDSILNDDAVEPFIKKKTVRLLTDRVAEVHHDSPEHFLFLEMVPDLVAQLKGEGSSAASRKAIVKQQGALIAIESFVSSLYPNSERSRAANSAAKVFLPALVSSPVMCI
jgi:hypothetical protein